MDLDQSRVDALVTTARAFAIEDCLGAAVMDERLAKQRRITVEAESAVDGGRLIALERAKLPTRR